MIGALHSSSAYFAPAFTSPAGKEAAAPEASGKEKAAEREDKQAIAQEVQRLKRRDQEVRTHEQAHLNAASGISVSGPHFETTQGPDGNTYVTGGHVQIDTSPASTPEATLDKARKIRAAALAPAQPSGADLSVAAAATRMEAEAQTAIREAEAAEATEGALGTSTGKPADTEDESAAPAGDLVGQAVTQGEKASAMQAHSREPGHLANCAECQRAAFGLTERPESTYFGRG